MSNELSHHGIIVFDAKRMSKGTTQKISDKAEYDAGAKYEEWAWKTARSLGSMSDDEYRKRYEAKWSDML